MLTSFDGLFWLLTALVLLQFLQTSLHREIQAVLLITTRHPGVTVSLFSLLFIPGVFLHEFSHYLMAKLLGIRTGKFSLFPRTLPDGTLQLGYIEAAYTDILRDSLVGIAPLLTGILATALIATQALHLVIIWDTLRNGQWALFFLGLQTIPTVPGFWIWFYLAFAISSTFLPSASDRHAWLPLGLVAAALILLVIFAGAGPWLLENLAPPINQFMRGTSLVLLVSIIIHGLSIIPFMFLHRLLTRITRLDVT